MKNKRVDLRLNSKIAAHRLAISKLEHYDKTRYTSAIHYIVSAIDAFEEPVEVTKSELRQVIREELRKAAGELRGAAIEPVSQYAAHAVQAEKPEESKKAPDGLEEEIQGSPAADQTQKKEERPEIDPATFEFMEQLGI
ncbi:hypothetical protein WKU36_00070 [Blautia sp. ICN-22010]|uniref:hypothetical protein n=1 Tax=Blautia sp. ICN-22010 TaxID=3134653 RepID=UPI0030BC4006